VFDAALRVIDDDGAEGLYSTTITAGTHWYVRDSDALAGLAPGLADVDGKPAVAYIQPDLGYWPPGKLCLAYAEDALGTSWREPVEVAPEAQLCAVVEAGGMPAVIYTVRNETFYYDLCYTRALDASLETWSEVLVLDTWALDHFYLECRRINGHIALLYHGVESSLEDKPRAAVYLRSADAIGAAWEEPHVVYVLGDLVLGSLDLELVNGKPALLLRMTNPSSLATSGIFYQASDGLGDTWFNAPFEFDYMGTNALCVADGRPALVHQTYSDEGDSPLFYVDYLRSSDADGSDWASSAAVTTDSWDETPFCPRMVADDERIYCCYLDFGSYRYGQMAVHSLDAAGTSWSDGEVLDPWRPDTYFGSVMRIIGGRAMLAYAVSVNGQPRVRLAVFAE
jgi:hypothetical protein